MYRRILLPALVVVATVVAISVSNAKASLLGGCCEAVKACAPAACAPAACESGCEPASLLHKSVAAKSAAAKFAAAVR